MLSTVYTHHPRDGPKLRRPGKKTFRPSSWKRLVASENDDTNGVDPSQFNGDEAACEAASFWYDRALETCQDLEGPALTAAIITRATDAINAAVSTISTVTPGLEEDEASIVADLEEMGWHYDETTDPPVLESIEPPPEGSFEHQLREANNTIATLQAELEGVEAAAESLRAVTESLEAAQKDLLDL